MSFLACILIKRYKLSSYVICDILKLYHNNIAPLLM